jgi:hypothetical protein
MFWFYKKSTGLNLPVNNTYFIAETTQNIHFYYDEIHNKLVRLLILARF